MTNVLANLARMTTSTTGTGTITLGQAVTGFNAFADEIASGSVITYAIEDGNEREVGQGTFTVSGAVHTLTRSPYSSTQGGARISLSGNAQVFVTAAAEDFAPFETGAAATAIAAAATAEAAAASAEAQAAVALAAAEASGAIQFFDTKAAAEAALAGLSEGDVVEVLIDEDRGDARTRYRVESSALVFKFLFGAATTVAATRGQAASAAVSLGVGAVVHLTEAGREGFFVLRSGDFSAHVTADADQAVYIAPAGGDGSSGALQRMITGGILDARWAGTNVIEENAHLRINRLIQLAKLDDRIATIRLPPYQIGIQDSILLDTPMIIEGHGWISDVRARTATNEFVGIIVAPGGSYSVLRDFRGGGTSGQLTIFGEGPFIGIADPDGVIGNTNPIGETTDVIVERIWVDGSRCGIRAGYSIFEPDLEVRRSRRIKIRDCRITDAGRIGIEMHQTVDCEVTGNDIHVAGEAASLVRGVRCIGAIGGVIEQNTIWTDNPSEADYGIEVSRSSPFSTFEYNNFATDTIIRANKIIGWPEGVIVFSSYGYLKISDNLFQNILNAAVRVTSADYVILPQIISSSPPVPPQQGYKNELSYLVYENNTLRNCGELLYSDGRIVRASISRNRGYGRADKTTWPVILQATNPTADLDQHLDIVIQDNEFLSPNGSAGAIRIVGARVEDRYRIGGNRLCGNPAVNADPMILEVDTDATIIVPDRWSNVLQPASLFTALIAAEQQQTP